MSHEFCSVCKRPLPAFPTGATPILRWDPTRCESYEVHSGRCARIDEERAAAEGVGTGFPTGGPPRWEELSAAEQRAFVEAQRTPRHR